VIDNEASDDATVIRVDSVNSHGTLLAVVQVIADLNLVIRKAYFSSDGNWFMDGQSVAKSSFFTSLLLPLRRYFCSSFMSEKN
jgi:UTP:GlnB (protein PII) uridylyltransferase